MSFDSDQPLRFTPAQEPTRQGGWFTWKRRNQTGSERYLRPGHFDAAVYLLFAAVLAIGAANL